MAQPMSIELVNLEPLSLPNGDWPISVPITVPIESVIHKLNIEEMKQVEKKEAKEVQSIPDQTTETNNKSLVEKHVDIDENTEQRIVIKFLSKSKKSAKDTVEMLRNVYGEKAMSRSRVYRWHKAFRSGRNAIFNCPKPGRPRTKATQEIADKLDALLQSGRDDLSLRKMALELNVSKETVRSILNAPNVIVK